MIYSGLEVGQYYEAQARDESCNDTLLIVTPAARMLFTFIQMYFIFLNSRVGNGSTDFVACILEVYFGFVRFFVFTKLYDLFINTESLILHTVVNSHSLLHRDNVIVRALSNF